MNTRQERVSANVSVLIYYKSAQDQVKIGTIGSDGIIVGVTSGAFTLEYSYYESDVTLSTSPLLDRSYQEAIVYRICEAMYVGQETVTDRQYCFARWRDALRNARMDANLEDDDEEWNVHLHEL